MAAMECQVKVCRSSNSSLQDIYHSCKLTVQESEDGAILMCTLKNFIAPIRVSAKDAIKKVLDSKANVNGVASIVLSEYHTGGITDLHIKKADPARLKNMLEQLKKYLPKAATTPCSRKKGGSCYGRRMLEASQAKTNAHSFPPPASSLSPLSCPSPGSHFYGSPSSTPTRTPVSFPPQLIPHKRPALFSSSTIPQTTPSSDKRRKVDTDPPPPTSSSPGFMNLGNSCYMNAVLQSLLSIKCFINEILPAAGTVGHNTLTQQLLLVMESPTRERLSHIRAILCKKGKDLTVFNEQDAQEVLLLFLDIVHNELLRITSENLSKAVSRNFELLVEQKLVCCECGHVKTLTDGIRDITLHINNKGSTLQDLLSEYFKAESVEYHCGECPCKLSSLSRSIVNLPRVLIITLKRYQHTSGKNNNAIYISSSIDVSKLLNKAVSMAPPPFSEIERGMVDSYSLSCVISHLGKASEYGHYIADVYTDKEWLTYSDKVVKRTSLDDVLEQRTCNSYLLMYIRNDCK